MALGARSRSHHQRTFLRSDETPEPGLLNSFKTSVSLARAFSLERKSQANGQVAYLKKKEQQLAYVTSARSRKLPPLENVVAQQQLLKEIRRDCVDIVLPAMENSVGRQRRLARQEAFLADRKARHDAAIEVYEREMDALSEEREARTSKALSRMRDSVQTADSKVDELLHEMEVDTENLGAKTEEDISDIFRDLNQLAEWRREQIDGFADELEGLDKDCKSESTKIVKIMVDQMMSAAHAVPGEIERIVEEKALHHNTVALENQKSVRTLSAKLHMQALEKTKTGKVRYHKGVLRWKQKRHQFAVEVVRKRIAGKEFRQPPALELLMEQVRTQQKEAFRDRSEFCLECFNMPLSNINNGRAKAWEEKNLSLNDTIVEKVDELLKELKEFKDGLDMSGEEMLKALCRDLEILDAREEWGSHETVADLVDTDLRPLLQECLDLVQKCLEDVSAELTKQDEAQHHIVCSFVAFFKALAQKQEQLQKGMEDVENNYRHDVEDCEDADEEKRNENEGVLQKYHAEMDDEVHHDALDKLKEVTFEHLDSMAQGYRDHCDNLLALHQRYPGDVAAFFSTQTESFCSTLGLVTDQKWQEEVAAAAEAAAAAAEAAAAETKKPAKGKSKEEPPPEEPSPAEDRPPPEEYPLAEGSGCVVLQRLTLEEFRKMVLEAPPWPVIKDATGTVDKDKLAESQGAAGGGEPPAEEEGQEEALQRPCFADGTEVLEVLEFEDPWVEDQLASARETVFKQLGMCRKHLDRIDTPGICREVRLELDQRLRRHTNRKGEVQVEWYMPRYNNISKHKDKFERFLIDAAKRNQAHDDRVNVLCEEMETLETAYGEGITELRAKVPQAEAMAFLTATERQARELGDRFMERGEKVAEELTLLATEAVFKIQREGQALLKACSTGSEGYSQKEIDFYGGELEELGDALNKRGAERKEKAQAIEAELEAKKQGPLLEFRAEYDEALKAMKEARKKAKEAKAAEEAAAAAAAAGESPPKKGK